MDPIVNVGPLGHYMGNGPALTPIPSLPFTVLSTTHNQNMDLQRDTCPPCRPQNKDCTLETILDKTDSHLKNQN